MLVDSVRWNVVFGVCVVCCVSWVKCMLNNVLFV